MRKLAPVFLILCLLSGCAMAKKGSAETAANTYQLYYIANADDAMGGDAVTAIQTVIENSQNLTTQLLAEEIADRLLEGPTDATLFSPFPEGTALRSLTVEGGRATVDLSAAYGALAGIQLTLADYCITLSLTQIPGISLVNITVQGEALAYRNDQTFRARDVLLTSKEDVVGTLDATLWFAEEDSDTLMEEIRVLELYEGDTQTDALMAALLAGPETKGLKSALPEDFSVLSIWTEQEICYVNLSSATAEALTAATAPQVVQVLVNSLCSLDNITGVKIRVDGESRTMLATVPIGRILQPMET